MNGAGGGSADGASLAIDRDSYARAILNILEDVNAERARLYDNQSALLNILEDVDSERSERKQAEEQVRALNAELEQRVEQRTLALAERSRELEIAADALAERERTFRTLADNIPINVGRHALDGRGLYLNRHLLATLGRPIEEIVGRPLQEVFPDGRFAALEQAIREVGATGKGKEILYPVSGTDGKLRSHAIHMVPELGPDGRPTSVLAVGRDITEQQLAEDRLRAAIAEAERANEAKSRFLAAASHDLRQPLSALSLYVGTLESKLGGEDRWISANIKTCVANLNNLLSDLLDLSKLQAGAVKPNLNDFSLDTIFSRVASTFAPEALKGGLALRCGYGGQIGRTDAVLFQRIVGNLVSNAIRYTERGGVLLTSRRRHGKLWVEVWDTGIGIPADKTEEIFEEFKQLGNRERDRSKGTGLGLAIVAKTAALLGLQIRVHSRLGRGSVFAVEVPVGSSVQPVRERVVRHRPLRIALVEDDADVRVALTYALTNIGHQVLAAPSGAALMPLLDGPRVDIVISDYRLADGETGMDVVDAVRRLLDARLPAMIITGDTDPAVIRLMGKAGILVQHKPIDLDVLQARIADVVAAAPAPADFDLPPPSPGH